MPRIAEPRQAAEPTSTDQRSRYLRILRAAEDLGAETDLDHVQMHEVAKRAKVAIGTLYRYFPSKTHLYVGVMTHQVEEMDERSRRRSRAVADPAGQVFDVLLRANRSMLSKPNLAQAMMNSANGAQAAKLTHVRRIDEAMSNVVLSAAGIDEPTARDMSVVRLVQQTWGGILQSSLNGWLTSAEAEHDLRLACELLIAGTSAGQHWLEAV